MYRERERGDSMARGNSVIDDDLLRRLRHVLVDEGISFSERLRRQASAYVAENEPITARKKQVKKWPLK